jgi:hypothetical protein
MATLTSRSQSRSSRSADRVKSPARTVPSRVSTRGNRKGKVRKEFWLEPTLLQAVKEELGAANEREAVEMALDLVLFRKELVAGARRLFRLGLTPLN